MFLKVTAKLVFVLSAFVLFFGAYPANAQKILDDYKKSMPKYEGLAQKDWEASTILYNEVPLGDESLAYSVRMPKDWKKVTDGGMSVYKLSNKIFGEISRYWGPAQLMGERTHFTVQAIELDFSLTAEQWFLEYLLKSGYNVQGMENVNPNRVDALYVFIDGKISYAVRAAAIVSGKRVILAQHFLPIERFQDERAQQQQILDSFKLKNIENELVEDLLVFHFLDIAEVQYPESWELRMEPLRSIDNMSARILNLPSKAEGSATVALDGKIDIRLDSFYVTNNFEELFDKYKVDLQKLDLVLGEKIEDPKGIDVHSDFIKHTFEVFTISSVNNLSIEYELWVGKLVAGEYYYLVSLLTPARDQDFSIWSRNTQAYKLVMRLLKPLEESILQE